jgi:microcystin-dependent protein
MLMFSQALQGGIGGFYLLNLSNSQSIPPGSGSFYFSSGGDPPGWYICDGRAVSRTADSALFSAIGTTYGAGDGSTTFNIPDPRGYFMRVLDSGAGIDPGRAPGSIQQDQLQDHTHPFSTGVNGMVGLSGSAVNAGAAVANTGVPNSGNHGTETRPKNMAAPMIIKR